MPRKRKDLKKVQPDDEEEHYYDIGSTKGVTHEEEEAEYLQEDEYNVESILDMKVEGGRKYYHIKWEGFPHDQNTWEPIEHLAKVAYMVESFEENYAKGKSLEMMAQENPGYFPLEEDVVDDFPLRKETKKKGGQNNEGTEVIFKKRRLNLNQDGEILFEKKLVNDENSNNFENGDDEGFQEITTFKEDLTKSKPRKRNNKEKTLTKAPALEDDFEFENTITVKSSKEKSSSNISPHSYASNKGGNTEMFATQINNDNSFETPGSVAASEKNGLNGKSTSKSLRGVVAGNKKAQQNKPAKPAPKKKDKTGSFRNKDKPKQILSIKTDKDGGLNFVVEWHRRSDGVQPDNSLVSSEEMKHGDPYFLIDFYEAKVIIINKKQAKKDKELPDGQGAAGDVGVEKPEKLEKEKPNGDVNNDKMIIEEEPSHAAVGNNISRAEENGVITRNSSNKDQSQKLTKEKEPTHIEIEDEGRIENKVNEKSNLLQVVPEEEKELELSNNPTERISPLKESPERTRINQTPTDKNISGISGVEERINSVSRISSPAEVMSNREEEIVINVRERGRESSSESEKKKHMGTLDSMLDFDTFEIHGQQHDQDWNQEDNQVQAQAQVQGNENEHQQGQGQGQGESLNPSLDFTLAQVGAEAEVEVEKQQGEQTVVENNDGNQQHHQEQQEQGNVELNKEGEEKEGGEENKEVENNNNNENQENQGSLVSVI